MTDFKSQPIIFNPGDEIVDLSWGVGGHAQVAVQMTPVADRSKVYMRVPPVKLIPIVFLPGIMGSNLRMKRSRQVLLEKGNNIAWRPDAISIFDKLDAPAKERQLRLDPDATEVDTYEMTQTNGEYDATGDLTETSDQRHHNVPDTLEDIGLLRSDPGGGHIHFSAAQKARARGWSEVMFSSYGEILKTLEGQLNYILEAHDGKRFPKQNWVDANQWYSWHHAGQVVNRDPHKMGNDNALPVDEAEIIRVGDCWYPVHAMGYNWLKSNGECAREIAQRIKDLIATYRGNGRDCPGVILVTHSMGGMLGRALLHPDYGNIADKILGICHNVMPTVGAAAAYKRLRAGFGGEGRGPVSWVTEKVLGNDGPKCTAVLANAQGGLELLPFKQYGTHWLKVKDLAGNVLFSWPGEDVAQEIYTRSDVWWRLINPDWIDPADQVHRDPKQGGKSAENIGKNATTERIMNAKRFSESIANTFAKPTFASYGVGSDDPAWGEIVWRVVTGDPAGAGNPRHWQLLADYGNGKLLVKGADGQALTLVMQVPHDAGDGTVPTERSARKVQAQVKFEQTGYDHQGSYENTKVKDSTLYSIIKIASAYDSTWWAKPNYQENE